MLTHGPSVHVSVHLSSESEFCDNTQSATPFARILYKKSYVHSKNPCYGNMEYSVRKLQ